MHEQPTAVDMPQEVVTEADAVGRALNDARDIGHDEGYAVGDVDDAEVRIKRGKMIVCDLRVRVGCDGQERRFADVREADKAHVGQQLELEDHVVFLAGKAGLGKARHLAGGRSEVLVAPAAAAALAEDEIVGIGHILDDLIRLQIAHDGTSGDLDDEVFTVLAAAALALPVFAVRRGIFALVAEVHQRRQIIVDTQNDGAAVAAVAAVRAARGHVFFPVKGHCAVAARAGLDRNAYFINKHEVPPLSVRFS